MTKESYDKLLNEIENMDAEKFTETYCKHIGECCIHQCFDFDNHYGYCDQGHIMFDGCNRKDCEDFETFKEALEKK